MKRRLLAIAVAAATVSCGLLGKADPVAAHGGDGSLIHACVSNSADHQVRIVGVNEGCKNNETAMHWPAFSSQTGIPLFGSTRVGGTGIVFTQATRTIYAFDSRFGTAFEQAGFVVPRSGVLSNLVVRTTTVANPGTAVTVTVVINDQDSGLAVATDGQTITSVSNSSAEVVVQQGDLIAFKLVEAGGVCEGPGPVGNCGHYSLSMLLD